MCKLLYTVILLVTFTVSCFGQVNDSNKKRKELIIEFTNKGKLAIDKGQFEDAYNFLLNARKLNVSDDPELAVYNTAFASMYTKLGAYDAAIEYEKRIVKQSKEYLGLYFAYSNIGNNYLRSGNVDSAVFYFSKQLTISENQPDFIGEASALNNIGFSYILSEQYDKAYEYCKKSYELLKGNKDKKTNHFRGEYFELWITVNDNLGAIYYKLGNNQKAMPLLEFAYTSSNTPFGVFNQHILNAIYCEQKQFDKARLFIEQCEKQSDPRNIKHLKYIAEMKLDFAIHSNNNLEIKSLSRLIKGYDFQLILMDLKEKNKLANLVSHFLQRDTKLAVDRIASERNLFQKQAEVKNNERNLLLAVSIFLILSGGVVIYLIRQNSRNKEENLRLNKLSLELELKEKRITIDQQNLSLRDFALNNDKNEIFETSIIKRIDEILKKPTIEQSRDFKTLLAEVKQKNRVSSAKMSEETEDLKDQFTYLLRKKHPELRKSQIQLCQLVMLDMPNKEIALIKGVSSESVKIAKNRLKHKLSIEGDISLYEYLNALAQEK